MGNNKFKTFFFLIIITIVYSGCFKVNEAVVALTKKQVPTAIYTENDQILPTVNRSPTLSESSTETEIPDQIVDFDPTVTFSTNQTATQTLNKELMEISSPLKGIDLAELSEIISNPFQYTSPGRDDGHHGTDFSFYRYKSFDKMDNISILSILPGTVRSVIVDRPPYGNMIMIETPLDRFSKEFLSDIFSQLPENEPPFFTDLYCPDKSYFEYSKDVENRSIYLLYAHMAEPATQKIGDIVSSGETLGYVGNTGNSGNTHLHLEMRVGPAKQVFDGLAHYDNSATEMEMENYCAWRVSGFFNQFDPMILFQYYLQNR